MSKFIDVEQFLKEESKAYISAQMKLAEKGSDRTEKTRIANKVVHIKVQMLMAEAPAADVVSREQYNTLYEENIRLRAELENMKS